MAKFWRQIGENGLKLSANTDFNSISIRTFYPKVQRKRILKWIDSCLCNILLFYRENVISTNSWRSNHCLYKITFTQLCHIADNWGKVFQFNHYWTQKCYGQTHLPNDNCRPLYLSWMGFCFLLFTIFVTFYLSVSFWQIAHIFHSSNAKY